MITKKDVQIVLQSQTKEATHIVISTLQKLGTVPVNTLDKKEFEDVFSKGELTILQLVEDKGIKGAIRLLRNSFTKEIFEDTDKLYEELTKNKKQ